MCARMELGVASLTAERLAPCGQVREPSSWKSRYGEPSKSNRSTPRITHVSCNSNFKHIELVCLFVL